jgi:xanthine/CO dehydrogenase XdhC/CoxF family maturation factor
MDPPKNNSGIAAAESPEEIALSIRAEIIAMRNYVEARLGHEVERV